MKQRVSHFDLPCWKCRSSASSSPRFLLGSRLSLGFDHANRRGGGRRLLRVGWKRDAEHRKQRADRKPHDDLLTHRRILARGRAILNLANRAMLDSKLPPPKPIRLILIKSGHEAAIMMSV
jgi:hypothetical protein